MDAKQLPARPSVEQFRKQAKDLLKARNSETAVQRIHRFHPRFDKKTEVEIKSAEFKLADSQLVIAREHAFESWPKFIKHIEAITRANSLESRFEQAADAIVSGDLAALEKLLAANPELIRARSTRAHGAPLIHYVASNGIEDFRQKTPANIVEITKMLLRAGADVDAATNEYGAPSTALGLAATSCHPAIAGNQLALLQTLIDAGAKVDGAPGGWSALVAALHNGRGDAAFFLAEHGARLDVEGAAGVGRLDIVKSFFNAKGKLQNGATEDQLKAGFAWACEFGRANVVEFLLTKGMRAETSFRRGESGLHWAAYGGHAKVVALLLQSKPDVNIRDQSHNGTPLGWALYAWANPPPEFVNSDYHGAVEHLIRAGATVDQNWLGLPITKKIRADKRMQAILSG